MGERKPMLLDWLILATAAGFFLLDLYLVRRALRELRAGMEDLEHKSWLVQQSITLCKIGKFDEALRVLRR